jgi:hypothetical protein|tara:strand:+ start:6908 stop:8149 length:1242 start_codon:yes stop_codon:yes gene_type:complete
MAIRQKTTFNKKGKGTTKYKEYNPSQERANSKLARFIRDNPAGDNRNTAQSSVQQVVADMPTKFQSKFKGVNNYNDMNSAQKALFGFYDDRNKYQRDMNNLRTSSPEMKQAYAKRFPVSNFMMETAPKFLPSGVGAMFAADRGMKANAEKQRIMNTPVNRPVGGFENFNKFFNEANEKNKITAAATLPEGAESVFQSPQDMNITAQPGRFVQTPSDMGIMPAMALSPQDMGITNNLLDRRAVAPRNIPGGEAADKAIDLAGRPVDPISNRQRPLDSSPMTLQDVADQERLQAIRNQIALNSGILANLPEGIDPTRIGSVQGAGRGLQSVFDMQNFVDNDPMSIYPQGYPTQKVGDFDTGLNFYGGNVAFGNTPEARAALETLRSNNPNQTFTNMLGGTALRRAEGGIASLYGK